MIHLRRIARCGCSMLAACATLFTATSAVAARGPEGKGAVDADVSQSTGEATLTIPIDVPKGTGGFQPDLTLRYSSVGEDGPFGLGWSLALGEIRRATRFGAPSFDDSPTSSDRFELDDELLVKGTAPGGATEYRTQTETFARIRRLGDSWEVTFANGVTARFGTTQETRIRRDASLSPSGDTEPVARWLLSELQDVNGNVVEFAYERGIDAGTAYPLTITYTLRGTPPRQPVGELRSVSFIYEDRPDAAFHTTGGVGGAIRKRVREIRSMVGNATHRRRSLYYGEGIYSTLRSRLTSTQVFGTDCPPPGEPTAGCSSMPRQQYTYTDPTEVLGPPGPSAPLSAQWSSAPWNPPTEFSTGLFSGKGKDGGVRLGDVDGDGLPDILKAYDGAGFNDTHTVWLNTGSGWVHSPEWSQRLGAVQFSSWKYCGIGSSYTTKIFFAQQRLWHQGDPPIQGQVIDMNGDGRADLVVAVRIGGENSCWPHTNAPRKVTEVWINQGEAGWVRDEALSDSMPVVFASTGETSCGSVGESHTANLETIVCSEIGHTKYRWFYPWGAAFADLDGDGRPDLVANRGPESGTGAVNGAWLNTEGGWVAKPEFTPPVRLLARASLIWTPSGLQLADLNGDGLTDLIKTSVAFSPSLDVDSENAAALAASGVWLNTGSGWCDATVCPLAARYAPPPEAALAREINTGLSNQGFGFGPRIIAGNGVVFSDVNGDGLVDLLRLDGSQAEQSLTWIQSPGAAAGGGSVWVEDRRFRVPEGMWTQAWYSASPIQGWIYDTGSRVLDWDGNGTADFVSSSEVGPDALWLSQTAIEDRVRQYSNGEGGSVRFEYASAIIQRDATLEASAAADVAALAGTTDPDDAGIALWTSLPVVSRLLVQGLDQASAFETQLVYAWPRYCPFYRSGLGFRTMKTILPDGSSGRTFFWQKHGRAGRLRRSEVSSGSQLVATAEATWKILDGSAVPGSLPGVDVGQLTAESQHAQYAGGTGAVHSASYEYSGFNFVTRIEATRPTGGTIIELTPHAPDETNWIIGRVASEITKSASTGAVLRSRQFSYAPGKGLLTLRRESVEPRATATGNGPVWAETSWTYDQFGNVVQTVDAEERSRHFCYDGDSTLGSGACPASATQTHSVLAGVRDPVGGVSILTADLATGELRAITRFNQDRASLTTDAFGRPTQLWVQPSSHGTATLIERRVYHDGLATPAGRSYIERFEQVGGGTEIRTARYFDGFRQVARNVYGTPTGSGYAGRAIFRDYAQRPVHESYEASCDQHCSNLAVPLTPAVVTTYDALGRPMTRATPDGVSVIDYRSMGRSGAAYDAAITKDAKGNLTQRLLDGDRVAWVDECHVVSSPGYVDPSSLSCGTADITTYLYEPTGEVGKIVDAVGPATDPRHYLAYEYDTLGRMIRTIDPDGGTSETSYDLVGNLFMTTNAREQNTIYTYDALDRLTHVEREVGFPDVDLTYDDDLNGTRRRQSVTEVGVYSLSYAYDDFGRERRRVQTTLGATLVADFEYDLLGRATKVTYPNGAVVTYGYEGAYLEQVCSLGTVADCVSAPQGTAWWVSDVVYDPLGREIEIHERPGVRRFSYNPSTYRLDQIRFTNLSNSDRVELSYLYDELGNVREIIDTNDGLWFDGLNANAVYTYDKRNRLVSSTIAGGATKWFSYDVLGNLTGRDGTGPGAQNQLFADPLRPHAITQNHLGQTYDYDADGNAIRRGSQHLSYDSDGRLKCAGSSPSSCDQAVFRYDVDGTRLSETTSAGSRILMGDLFEWEAGSNNAIVNVMAFGRRIAFEYSFNQTLRTAWLPSGWELPVPPRLLGPGLALAILSLALAYLLWLAASGAAVSRPVPAFLQLLIMASLLIPNPAWAGGGGGSSLRRWISYDHLGNAIRYTEPSGSTVKGRTFEPLGKVIAETSTTEPTPQLFTGQRYETNTGLYDFRARWYDPEAGRFLSVDPIVQDVADPQTHNAYGYVRNNPVNLVDPDGLGFWKKFWNVLKIVLSVVAIVVAYINPYIGALLSVAVAAINFAQDPSLMNGLLLVGSGLLAYTASGAGSLLGSAASTVSPLVSQGAGALSLAQVAIVSQAASDIVDSAKQLAESQSEPLWETAIRYGVFDYKEPLGGSYVLEALTVVGPGKLLKGARLGVRAGKALIRKLDTDIVKKIKKFNRKSLRDQKDEYENLSETYEKHLQKYGQRPGETTGETNRMERELRAMEEILRGRGQLGDESE